MSPTARPPGVIVFEVATARRVGAQLCYNGGPRFDEIRHAVRVVQGSGPPQR